MDATSLIDTILDRSVVLGYGNTGLRGPQAAFRLAC
jgi:hypothetical protein